MYSNQFQLKENWQFGKEFTIAQSGLIDLIVTKILG